MLRHAPESETLVCPHGARCGGCAFLGVPYPEQLERKRTLVRSGFGRYPELSALTVANATGASPTVAYRARAKLVFGEAGALGLFERDSHAVVDIPECRVLAPTLSRVANAARRAFKDRQPPLDGLDLRLVDDGVLVTLIAPRGTAIADLKELGVALSTESKDVRSVSASFREPGAATVLGTNHLLLSGNEVERHHLLEHGPYHLAAHGAFTQAHLGQANAAHARIELALKQLGAKRVLELYAGSGALSLRLAGAGFAMTAVEAFAPALAHAERAAREQDLRLRTVSGQAERVLGELSASKANFDALIVNPPRRGLSVEVRRAAAALQPAAIVYMSCEPATLARDLAHLRLLGYAAEEVGPFDMIPHSAAVECLVVARRAPLPAPTVLYEDEQVIAVSKSGFEPTTGEPGFSGSLLARVRLLPGAGAAVALTNQQLDPDSSGVCLFARTQTALPELERAFGAGTQTFVALARGISHKRGRVRRPVREGRRVVQASVRYLREGVRAGHSLLTIWPERATPAQFRQLFASVGHPVLGDTRFGDPGSNSFFEHRHGLDRAFLHCSAVTLALGTSHVSIEAALPGELRAVLESSTEQAATPR